MVANLHFLGKSENRIKRHTLQSVNQQLNKF